MKRTLKVVALVVGALLLVAIAGFIYINVSGIPSYTVETIDFQASRTPESIARGEKLTSMLCAGCHINTKTGKLTGARMLDAPAEFGEIHSPNITGDLEHGIGEWTDGELLFLLRTGIKKDGQYAPPYMAKLPQMADADMDAIISFLRSDHPMVAADATPDQPSIPSFLTKALSRIAFKPFPMPTEVIPMPDTSNLQELGRYLAHNLECFSCHSADFKTNNYLEPDQSPGYFAGGNEVLDKQGRVVLSSNLTPDQQTGIGTWTREEFIKSVKYGLREGQHALRYPMAPYTQLSDYEAGAIYEYLLTIPAIDNRVERVIF